MAKTASKSAEKEPKKSSPAKTSKPKSSSSTDEVEKASVGALEKLKSLNLGQELQNDLEWCLGSYRSDKNPVGLYAVLERVLVVFKNEKEKKTKGVTAKLVTDLEKVVQSH